MARFGDLRCPSEVIALRWSDIKWDSDRVLVHSKKTRKQGKPKQIIPLFSELKPYLDELWDLLQPGDDDYVIQRYRSASQNLRTQFGRIVERAGVLPWPRLFHNLRATRQSELTAEFPAHVVSEWLGNTVSVAQKHYVKALPEHFDQATGLESIEPHMAEAFLQRGFCIGTACTINV